VDNVGSARYLTGSAGTVNTAVLVFGGFNNPTGGNKNLTESWNGSNWTEVADLNTARNGLGGAGSSTAALGFGGAVSPALTELWNGSNWTEVADLNTGRDRIKGGGTNSQAIGFGGQTAPRQQTEEWNGSSWSETNDLNTGRGDMGSAGNNSAALGFGGYSPVPAYADTELWTLGGTVTKTISTD